MDEESLELDGPYPVLHLNRAMLDRVDQVLLAVAGRLWEVVRETLPQARQAAKTIWSVEEMRTSPLGQRLLLIADSASGGYAADPLQVKWAMKLVLRTLYGDPLDEGYAVPEQFHTTDLGQIFDEAHTRARRTHDTGGSISRAGRFPDNPL